MNETCSVFFGSLLLFLHLTRAQQFVNRDYSTANLSTTWINSDSDPRYGYIRLGDGSKMRYILLSRDREPNTSNPLYACGFYCNGNCETYLFGIFITDLLRGAAVVWSANRNNPVKLNAILQLNSEGDLVLRDVDGSLAWSTNTSNNSVVGLNLTHFGNLVLVDVNNSIIWQSFDHPTDALVLGQSLISGQKLISSISDTNWTRGLYSFSITNDDILVAFIESNPPQAYFNSSIMGTGGGEVREASYLKLQNGSLDFFMRSGTVYPLFVPQASRPQYLRLMPDGHLNVYLYTSQGKSSLVVDVFFGIKNIEQCQYPMVCGKYGICSNGQCNCPLSDHFVPVRDDQPNIGCSVITPLTCNSSDHHRLIHLPNVTYFTFSSDINDVSIDQCREACLRNCSCKAALFRYELNSSRGACYLPSDVFSFMGIESIRDTYNISAFIKVQMGSSSVPPNSIAPETNGKNSNRRTILGLAIGGSFMLVVIIGVTVFILRKEHKFGEDEEDYLDHVQGITTRFSFEELKIATQNFSIKLGEGGFGSVFEGVLKDNSKIAVKWLNGIGQVKMSFLAEVESIGSIHHVNLVRLIGFCAEKSQRLLIYEYMANGSLDKWIYYRGHDIVFDWRCRRNIIQDVAKGLAYLHEECRQKIFHLDIKPQNILLDENFNAKLSDFGLSKLISRDQSNVVTTMRGTPGYLAPEWLNAVITEKVDVYSFGVVVLEILCGRKNFELSETEERIHLLSLFKMKVEEGRLFDLIDKRSEDMQSHGTEVLEVMQVAAWCLQRDYTKRPSMSVVVKVLDGDRNVEKNLDYEFWNSQISIHRSSENHYGYATPLLPSLLSAPR